MLLILFKLLNCILCINLLLSICTNLDLFCFLFFFLLSFHAFANYAIALSRKQIHLSSGKDCGIAYGTTELVCVSPDIIHHRVLCQFQSPRPFQFTFLIQRDAKKPARQHLLSWTGKHYRNEGTGWMSIYLYWAQKQGLFRWTEIAWFAAHTTFFFLQHAAIPR